MLACSSRLVAFVSALSFACRYPTERPPPPAFPTMSAPPGTPLPARKRVQVRVASDQPITLRRHVFLAEAHADDLPHGEVVCVSPCASDLEYMWPGSNFSIEGGGIMGDPYVSFHWTGGSARLEVKAGNPRAYAAGTVLTPLGYGLALLTGAVALGVLIDDKLENASRHPHAPEIDRFDGPLTPVLATTAITGGVLFAIGLPLVLTTGSEAAIIDDQGTRYELTAEGFRVRF